MNVEIAIGAGHCRWRTLQKFVPLDKQSKAKISTILTMSNSFCDLNADYHGPLLAIDCGHVAGAGLTFGGMSVESARRVTKLIVSEGTNRLST